MAGSKSLSERERSVVGAMQRVLAQLVPPSRDLAGALDVLAKAYTEPGRYYHTLDHIGALLQLAAAHRSHLLDPESVELAILYHDCVYDPRRSDNEVQSAALARAALLELGAHEPFVGRVVDLIIMTQHGAQTPPPSDTDLALFLDFDLSILAAERSVYDAYAGAIRLEYAHVGDRDYRQGRSRVLKHFLGEAALYRSQWLKDRLELPARANLARELQQLATG